jgi:hypothetical protein
LAVDIVCAFVPVATGGGLLFHGGEMAAKAAIRVPEVIRAGQAVEKIGQALLASTKNGGENFFTKRGKQAHKNYRDALGDGYEYEKTLPSGKRVDALDAENGIVRELKPDNPRAIARGLRQVKKYAKELSDMTGRVWTYFVDTYKR